ncbi:MAG: hypothetical protein J1E40_00450 [Oscillospiraceae bacterium]|nr:hypothetical protein [Oscillospiraceae bacterium]
MAERAASELNCVHNIAEEMTFPEGACMIKTKRGCCIELFHNTFMKQFYAAALLCSCV